MSQILEWLTRGDLRSNGMAPEVAELVLENPALFSDLMAGLQSDDDVVRGRTADALEKVSRKRPDLLSDHIPALIEVSRQDGVPMVKMHLAMIFGNLAVGEPHIDQIQGALLGLLEDQSVFVRSWAISSLCILGRKWPDRSAGILKLIEASRYDKSIAIRTRVEKAMRVLIDPREPFPPGWIKSQWVEKALGQLNS